MGFAALARPTFDVALAETVSAAAWGRLDDLGHDLVGAPGLILEEGDLADASPVPCCCGPHPRPADERVVALLDDARGAHPPTRGPIAEPPDAASISAPMRAAAEKVATRLRAATVGIVGEHPVGFDPCAYDAKALAGTIGIRAETVSLPQQFARAEAATGPEVETVHRRRRARPAGHRPLTIGADHRSSVRRGG